MRISDWSSDVCSSDLGRCRSRLQVRVVLERVVDRLVVAAAARQEDKAHQRGAEQHRQADAGCGRDDHVDGHRIAERPVQIEDRSVEHTSELQSLMRLSYAVFCLKKNNKKEHKTHYKTTQQTHNDKKLQYKQN